MGRLVLAAVNRTEWFVAQAMTGGGPGAPVPLRQLFGTSDEWRDAQVGYDAARLWYNAYNVVL
jgi:hypothetical protein